RASHQECTPCTEIHVDHTRGIPDSGRDVELSGGGYPPCRPSRRAPSICHGLPVVARRATSALPVMSLDDPHADKPSAAHTVRHVVRIFLHVAEDDFHLPHTHV